MHASTRWLIVEIFFTVLLLALLSIARYPVLLPYAWHKMLHIFGVVIFMGNIIVTGAWMYLAERNGQAATLHFAARVVNWADVFFTAPGILLILVNGLIMATRWGGLGTSWIAVGLGLFTLSGVVWALILIRYQDRLIRLSLRPTASGEQGLPEAFFHVLHRWYFWGIVATILPVASLVVMVLKPKFW
ncbi:MAG: DUF2269 family protein [Vulcanimicrobiaceae bacterium]